MKTQLKFKTQHINPLYLKTVCDQKAKETGEPYGMFRDASGNLQVERLNPNALYPYAYISGSEALGS